MAGLPPARIDRNRDGCYIWKKIAEVGNGTTGEQDSFQKNIIL